MSVRRLVLEVRGKARIRCDLKRHLSPRTVGAIARSLPLEGHAHFLGKSVAYIETAVDSGAERPRREFRRGDVAFMPSSGSICFFLSDAAVNAMTPLGRLLLSEGADELKSVAPGDVLCLYEEAAK